MKNIARRFKSGGGDPAGERGLRSAIDARFAMIGGQPTLFSESSQGLYTLNPVAALIWCCFEEGGGAGAAEARLVEAGVAEADARSYIEDAVGHWLRLGLLHVDFGPTQTRHAYSFRVEDTLWRVESESGALSRQIAALFDLNPRNTRDPAEICLKAIGVGDDVHVFCQDRRAFVCKVEEVTPRVKSLIIERALASQRRDLAFHAACMSRGGANLLISGDPGAGKTTTTLHLAARGFEYHGDDITLISPDGLARGIACAPTVKSGAWDLVARIRPDLADKPTHRRLDGLLVRYLEPGVAGQRAKPVRWIVFIQRAAGGAARVEPIGAVEALRRLIAGSTSVAGRLSVEGFVALRRLLESARCYELTYQNSDEAAQTIEAICDAQA